MNVNFQEKARLAEVDSEDDDDDLDDTRDLLNDQPASKLSKGYQRKNSEGTSLNSDEKFEITESEQNTAERPKQSRLSSHHENRNSLPADKFQQFMMNGNQPALEGFGSSAAGLAPFANNYRSIENENETTLTNLADEFLKVGKTLHNGNGHSG